MKNIIIDTDIGDDIDDVLALAYALKLMSNGKCNLIGVTTVFKNTKLRAKIASYFLKTAGFKDIPVHAGAQTPFVNEVEYDEIPNQYLPEMSDVKYNDNVHAVDFMYNMLKNSDYPISLLAIGALTNIALLIRNHPDVIEYLSEIYIMGGCFYNHMNEWNIECDPEAAEFVISSGIKLKFIGLDVTTKCKLTQKYIKAINLDNDENKLLMNMMKEWFKQLDREGQTTPLLHDPLALHAMISDDVKFRQEKINIELYGTHTRGASYIEPYRLWGGTPPDDCHCYVAYDVDSIAFVDTFFNSVFK